MESLGGRGCPDLKAKGPMVTKWELVQEAMDVMMVDNNITTVPSDEDTSNSLGVHIWTDLPWGHDAAS